MHNYVKFINEILAKKMKLRDYEIVALTEECNSILQKKLPQKLKDLVSFTITFSIRNATFEKALYDLGVSINLMLLSILRKLSLGEARLTIVIL